MLLKERLSEYKKDKLIQYAKDLELKNYSGLRKAALIDKICAAFCTEEMMRSRLSCMTAEELSLFRRACRKPQALSLTESSAGIRLALHQYGYFDAVTDKLRIFEDIAEIFDRIDDEAFRAAQLKKGWLIKCLRFSEHYYGIFPMEVLHKLYRLKVKSSIEEMNDLLLGMPMDLAGVLPFSMERLGLGDLPEDAPIYSSRDLLVHLPLLDADVLVPLLQEQAAKPFYIPSAAQLDEICRVGFESGAPAYRKLDAFFTKKLNFSQQTSHCWCLQVWATSQSSNSPADILDMLDKAGLSFDSEKALNEVLVLLSDAHNSTRLRNNRGNTPNELQRVLPRRAEKPLIVPKSSAAAVLPKDAKPQRKEMVFRPDTSRKIYPNDPCPCGSGKKYKKCCYLKK